MGQPYVYEVTTSTSFPGNVHVVAPLGLPPWLVLDARGDGTATLSGTPIQANDVWSITLEAQDNVCGLFGIVCAKQEFFITVSSAPNSPPAVVPPGIPDQTAQIGAAFSLDVAPSFTDADGNALLFGATGLPASFALSGSVISGTPTPADVAASPYTVTINASDGLGGVASDTFLLAITQNQLPVVVAPGIPDQRVNQGDRLDLDVAPAFSDPDSDPLTFAATGLPAAFRLVGSTISGVAGPGAVSRSPFTVTVTASDGRGGIVADSFVLELVPLATADVFLSAITPTPAPVARGGAVEWGVTVGNAGPSPSGSIPVTIQFAGTPFTFTTNPCTLTVAGDRQLLACTTDPIASGATQTLKLAGSSAQPGDVFVTAAIDTGDGLVPADPNPGNNSSAASLNVAETIVTKSAQSIALGAVSIATGDLDNDGFVDAVLVAPGEAAQLLLDIDEPTAIDPSLAGPGDDRRGLASVPVTIGDAMPAAGVALADFDNDGDLDVVVANGAGTPSVVFRNDGHASFTQLATLGAAARDDRVVATADMDGDGFADIVIASGSGNFLYTNKGGTSFAQSSLPGGAGALDVVLIDAVGSALPDLIVVAANGATALYENSGGSFGAPVAIDAGPSVAAASGDFNRDGRADLVLARATAGNAAPSNPVYLNNSSGGFVAVGPLGGSPTTDVIAGDVDGDGVSDVIAINATGAHQVFIGDGSGNFRLHPNVLLSRGSTRGAIGAIGRMKRTDLVLTGPDALQVFFNDAHGGFGLGDTTRPVIQLVGTADVTMEVGGTYSDAGATATDDVDGALTPTVTNPVDPAVIGTYTVTYAAVDSAGNAAVPVTRTVHINARAAQGGGGGAADSWLLLVLTLALAIEATRLRGAARGLQGRTLR